MSTMRLARRNYKLLLVLAMLLWLVLGGAVAPARAGGPYLYVPSYNNNKLIVSNLDGTSPAEMVALSASLKNPTGIAIDVKGEKLYIANYWDNRVIKAGLNGLAAANMDFGAVTLDLPMGLALDLANSKIYIVNNGTAGSGSIVKANLDGSNAVKLTLGGNLTYPMAIAVDTANKYMYVSSLGATSEDGKVVRADLDGNNVSVLSFGSVAVKKPSGIALDFGSSTMYITTFDYEIASNNHLIRSGFDGSGAVDLGNPSNLLLGANGIAVDDENQYLYLASSYNSKVVRTNLNGGDATDLTAGAAWTTLSSYPYFVALDTRATIDLPLLRK